MRGRRLITLGAAVGVLAPTLLAGPATGACSDPPAMPKLQFGQRVMVDTVRPGGEPMVIGLADGTLIYSAHAGTTHLDKRYPADPDFATTYTGSVGIWRSTDGGATWRHVGFGGGETGTQVGPGFSDPTLAIDAAGTPYLVASNFPFSLYSARSEDGGKTWENNPLAGGMTDRPWLAADRAGELYMIAQQPRRALISSKDGGRTWNWGTGFEIASGSLAPIAIDQRNGRLYLPSGSDYTNRVQVFTSLRDGSYANFRSRVFEGLPHDEGFFTVPAVDDAGNVYVVSNTSSSVRVAHSTDGGVSWETTTIRSRPGYHILWPWISAGADGRVGVAWLEGTRRAEDFSGGHDYRVYAAQSVTARGWRDACGDDRAPVYQAVVATPAPVHSGHICSSGLGCVSGASPRSDRRLGDYFTTAITADGRLLIAYADTSFKPQGIVSHPAFVAQSGGVDFRP